MIRPLAIAMLSLAAAMTAALDFAWAPAEAAAPAVRSPADQQGAVRGMSFAQARCSACHSIGTDAVSPSPEAPPFDAVANQPGLTRETLRAFLRNSHNYPAAMNFTIDAAEIDDLVEYMLTLQSRSYRPRI